MAIYKGFNSIYPPCTGYTLEPWQLENLKHYMSLMHIVKPIPLRNYVYIYSNWKVHGTVPTYWFVWILYKPISFNFWYLHHLFLRHFMCHFMNQFNVNEVLPNHIPQWKIRPTHSGSEISTKSPTALARCAASHAKGIHHSDLGPQHLSKIRTVRTSQVRTKGLKEIHYERSYCDKVLGDKIW